MTIHKKLIVTTLRNNDKTCEAQAAKRAFLERLKNDDSFMNAIKINKTQTVLGADYVAMYECEITIQENTNE